MGYEVPGELFIWLALVFNLLAGLAFFLVAKGNESFSNLAHRAYHLFTGFALAAGAYLYYLFFSHNYAFKYVFEYNERSQPFIYILSGFWGGQEGTYLLWLIMNALCGYLIIKWGAQYKNWAMAIFSLINLFFLLLMIKLSPFALLPEVAIDGLGLNPLLRDPWMVIHPPIIFMGYSIAAVPFCIAMAALALNDYSTWVKRIFPWAAVCALMLAAGNILGGYWAYKTLGWGGYWAWDPVENSSFVPWVIAVALIHGLIMERRSGVLRKTNILMASLLFLLVVYGTFLTRSGVLADFSVHSFTDLGINGYLVGFMVLFTVITLFFFSLRASKIESKPLDYNFFGREFLLFTGMTVMFVFGMIVMFWSSLPLLSGMFGEPRAADIATYNSFAIPLSIIMAFLLTVSPLTNFVGYKMPGGVTRAMIIFALVGVVSFGMFYFWLGSGIAVSVISTIVVSGMIVYMHKSDTRKALIPALAAFFITVAIALMLDVKNHLFVLFFATAAMAMVSNFVSLFGFLPGRWRLMGGELTHFGFGIMLIGVLASSAFTSNEKLVINKGESERAGLYGIDVEYVGMVGEIQEPNNELILNIDDGSSTEEVRPQLYYSSRMDGIMRKPYVFRSLMYDLYMAPEQIQRSESEDHLISLTKGVWSQVGDLEMRFDRYEMGDHDKDNQSMKVIAIIEVGYENEETMIMPAIIHTADSKGQPMIEKSPSVLEIGDMSYEVILDQVIPDKNMIMLEIPGLTKSRPEKLVIDISKKPIISLVWFGTTLIMIGGILTIMRRRKELPQTA